MDLVPARDDGVARLAVVALVDEGGPRGWAGRVLDALELTGRARLVGVLASGAPGPGATAGWLGRRLARALDGPASARRTTIPAGTVDLVLDLRTAVGGPPGPAARLGRWRLRFDGGPDPVAATAGAVRSGRATLGVRLEDEHGRPLRAGTFGVLPHTPWSSLAAAASSFAAWPAWCAVAAAEGRLADAPFGARPRDDVPATSPSSARAAARALRHLARKALWAEVWTVGVSRQDPASVLADGRLRQPRWLEETGPRGLAAVWRPQTFAADPFLYLRAGQPRLLFEAWDYGTARGWIAEADPLAAGPRTTVFRNDWHWSYPYVFVDDGVTYCLPETADAAEAVLHRLGPAGFEPVAALLPGQPVLDPSLVRHAGRYWLFCGLRDGPLLNTALHLFVADGLTGPYRPHRDNPVKLDVRSARPGGTIFSLDGVLHRPGQDCGEDYGAALVVHRVDELSEDAYRETVVAVLRPQPPYGSGLHTLSVAGDWVAVDAKRHAFSPPLLVHRLVRAVRRS